jgi:hypothetical protein
MVNSWLDDISLQKHIMYGFHPKVTGQYRLKSLSVKKGRLSN